MQSILSPVRCHHSRCCFGIDKHPQGKFFFSGQYADKFKARAESLVVSMTGNILHNKCLNLSVFIQNRKGDIVFALQIHNTVGIDTIQAEMRKNNAMLAKLFSLLDHRSERDEDLDRMMRDLGGRNKVLGDDELLTTMAGAIQTRKGNKDNQAKSALVDGAKFSRKEDVVLSATERHELRLPLDNALEHNAKFYAAKLDAQISRIASQINRLQSSSETILKTLNSGIWERIVHPDLRHVWRDNCWRTTVEARLFVMAVHDYFDDLFQGGSSFTDGVVDQRPVDASAETPNPPESAHAAVVEDRRLVNITAADKWCLQYLTLRHTAPLMEVFDADASGFIRIAEVNAFCQSIPEGLNLLQWLAYWAEGASFPCLPHQRKNGNDNLARVETRDSNILS